MKTAGRKNPNHGVAWPRNRAHGAEGQNRTRLIKWAEKQEKFQPKEMCFFLTSTFIELIGSYALGGKDEYCCRCDSAVPPQDTAYDRRLTAEILQPSGICRRMPRCTRLLSSAFFDHPNARPPIPQTFHRDQKKQPCHQNYRVLSF